MSGVSNQGVGAALCANTDGVSAVSAAAIKRALVESLVILHAPSNHQKKFGNSQPASLLNKSRTPLSRQYGASIRHERRHLRLCDYPLPTSRLSSGFGLKPVINKSGISIRRTDMFTTRCRGVAVAAIRHSPGPNGR